MGFSLSQWLNFKLFGITYLVGRIKSSNFFFRVHWLSEVLLIPQKLSTFFLNLQDPVAVGPFKKGEGLKRHAKNSVGLDTPPNQVIVANKGLG